MSDKITSAQYHHFFAFSHCIMRADKYIRDHAGIREIGTVVAEDVPEMRKFLRAVPKMWRDNPITGAPGTVQPTLAEKAAGYVTQEAQFRVSRIRNSIHFVEKGDEPLSQLADACAFGFRRYFSEQKFGLEFVRSILDKEPPLEDFSTKTSGGLYIPIEK